MNKIKIGQVGITHEHANGKIKALRAMPDVYEIVGVVNDVDTTSAARFAGDKLEPYEGVTWMTEEELFAVPGLQAVAVETANADLVPTALRCAKRGLHMHMDKPGGEELAPFKELLACCEEKKLAFQMGYMLRNNPAVQFCQKAVREGWFGDIFEIYASFSHDYGGDEYQEYLGEFSGGIMFNLGCHPLDLIISLMGRPKNVTPYLQSTANVRPDIVNNGFAVLEYPNATAALRSCSMEIEGGSHRRFTVNGTNGTFELCPLEIHDGTTPLKARLTLKEEAGGYAKGSQTVTFEPMSDRYEDQLLELARIINGEIENPYTYDHDCLVQEVLLAAAGYTKWS